MVRLAVQVDGRCGYGLDVGMMFDGGLKGWRLGAEDDA